MDKGCENHTIEHHSLYVALYVALEHCLIEPAVVAVYGVLFADWKQENEPFQGVSTFHPIYQ
jgi:hypothetical protein